MISFLTPLGITYYGGAIEHNYLGPVDLPDGQSVHNRLVEMGGVLVWHCSVGLFGLYKVYEVLKLLIAASDNTFQLIEIGHLEAVIDWKFFFVGLEHWKPAEIVCNVVGLSLIPFDHEIEVHDFLPHPQQLLICEEMQSFPENSYWGYVIRPNFEGGKAPEIKFCF